MTNPITAAISGGKKILENSSPATIGSWAFLGIFGLGLAAVLAGSKNTRFEDVVEEVAKDVVDNSEWNVQETEAPETSATEAVEAEVVNVESIN